MSRAKCDGDFYFTLAEKYYAVKPSSETAMFLAQAFQSKGDYAKAIKYLNEALAVEQDPAERQLLLVRIALIDLVANDIPGQLRRFCRSGYLLGRLRHDVESHRTAACRFGIHRVCQNVAECVPQPFPDLGGVLLQRAAGRFPLYRDLWYGRRCRDFRTSPLINEQAHRKIRHGSTLRYGECYLAILLRTRRGGGCCGFRRDDENRIQ